MSTCICMNFGIPWINRKIQHSWVGSVMPFYYKSWQCKLLLQTCNANIFFFLFPFTEIWTVEITYPSLSVVHNYLMITLCHSIDPDSYHFYNNNYNVGLGLLNAHLLLLLLFWKLNSHILLILRYSKHGGWTSGAFFPFENFLHPVNPMSINISFLRCGFQVVQPAYVAIINAPVNISFSRDIFVCIQYRNLLR